MRNSKILLIPLIISLFALCGCRKVQIFEAPPVTEVQEVEAADMIMDAFYVKNGTKFEQVYMPQTNAKNEAQKLVRSRVMCFLDDEPMIPTHYINEIVAYKSADITLFKKGITLERYKDLGWSLGIYGGKIESDGFYHLTISRGTIEGSNAEEAFSYAQVDEVRIVSIGGISVKDLADADCGVFVGLEKGKSYTVEFYLGTMYYTYNFTADCHFLQAYEYYYYPGETIKDTKLGYISFATPTDLKSGYYNINGTGLFLYHSYEKGNGPEEEDLNESYYKNEKDQILQYTRQYNLSIPMETRDMLLTINYGIVSDTDGESYEIGGYLISPEGVVYELNTHPEESQLYLSLDVAKPGDWTIGVYPRTLQINGIETTSDMEEEETVCEEEIFEIEEGMDYQAVYADIVGKGDVYASIIAEDGRTYVLETVAYKTDKKTEERYLVYRFPHLNAGTYILDVYHYKSETEITNIKLREYDPQTNELK